MPEELSFDFSQNDDEVIAFVLRVRQLRKDGLVDRTIVDLSDSSSLRTHRLNSLEDAFAEIRGALKLLGETTGSPDTSH